MRPIAALASLLLCTSAFAQKNVTGTAEVRLALDRLNTLGSVLMIAAHPDDENTALLAYFARGRHLRTAYLALTRGEGGQNLIGPEQGERLGLIRTDELLAARAVDGGEQYFTRAIDFGFSKTADETIRKWGRERILGDIVWTIRRFRPDVIVFRFSGTPRDGHGHHQTSAILGKEAFTAAADPRQFPEQLAQGVTAWQAKRMFYNVFAFTREQEREAEQMPNRLEIDTGEYSPLLGYSYGEIAGISRSQHRSQGMGSSERKGSQKNALVLIGGEPASADPFDGIDTSWKRVAGGAAVEAILTPAIRAFDPLDPAKTIPALVKARPLIAAIDDPWARRKLGELDETLALCTGLWVDASAERYKVTPGGTLKIAVTAVNRSRADVKLLGVSFTGAAAAPALKIEPAVLAYNKPANYSAAWNVAADQPYTQPYWLEQPADGPLYRIPRPELLGLAMQEPVLEARFRLNVQGAEIELRRPVQHRYVDRVTGEQVRPLLVVPPVSIDLAERALVFVDEKPRRIEVPVKAHTANVAGELRLELPAGWRAEPATHSFRLAEDGEQKALAFTITPPAAETTGVLRAVATVGGREVGVGLDMIDYPHIPQRAVMPPATAQVTRANVRTLAKRVGYVMGPGDEVPLALKQMGIEVSLLTEEDLARGDLAKFDAIVTGVRAYNTRADLRANQQRLLEYVRAGGTMLVQYNVLEGGFMGGNPALLEKIGPYPIRISRDRVTVEDGPMSLTNPQQLFLKSPNVITERDFAGWVQERGLYFASQWDPQYETVFTAQDPGEPALAGGTLFTRYGKGAYIFSAYSWFRQLPAGVPGAWRIFANLISAGQTLRQ
jgi:LmbE family N-acetylglucosaminyl deacetylase